MMKKILALIFIFALLLCGCSKKSEQTETTAALGAGNTVGICLPDFALHEQGKALAEQLEKAGYQVLIENAAGDMLRQHAQVQAFVNMQVACLVVAAIDAITLGDVLEEARQGNIPVIALDRMLMYTQAVTACVAPDTYAIGQQLGKYILEEEQLKTATEPVKIEFFMGAPDNNNSLLFYNGVMEQLQPYINSGVLQSLAGRKEFEDVCLRSATMEQASDRCFDYLTEYYLDDLPDVFCVATDALAAGCIDALVSFALEPGEDWPLIVSGQLMEEGVENLLHGYQSVSAYADEQSLVDTCAQWVCAVMKGETITGSEVSNGLIQVPSYLQEPVLVTEENCREIFPEEQ